MRTDQSEIDSVLTFLEKEEGRSVKEWGVSNATLEEGSLTDRSWLMLM